jgi:uncharacterized surface anchored protein
MPLALAGLMFVFCVVGQAWAGHASSLTNSDFEIDADADLVVDEDPNPFTGRDSLDWTNVDQARRQDSPSGQSDDAFGQGTKENTAVPSVVSGSIPPNKSDLLEFGVFQERNEDGNFLHLYWTRVQDPSGTTNMDFEFNQATQISPNGVTPVRTVGDLLIIYDLAKGGTVPALSLRQWIGSEWGLPVDLSTAALATGSINSNLIPQIDSDGIGALDPRTFGEASIDLSIIFNPAECQSFGSAYLKSRSSDSFTAALKDFIEPVPVNVSNCGSITIIKTDDGQPAGAALAGAEFTLYLDSPPLAADQADPSQPGPEDSQDVKTCTTSVEGRCTMIEVLAGEYWVVETVTPAGHDTAPPQAVEILADEALSLIFVDPRRPATVDIIKVDDAGAALAGAAFSLYADVGVVGVFENGVDVPTGRACTTGADGTCSITDILPPGDYCVVETQTPVGHDTADPQCLNLDLDETVTLTFTDSRQPASLHIVKKDDANEALAGATFTLYSDVGTVGVFDEGIDPATTFSCTTASSGACSIADILPPGDYCVVETVTPAGHDTASAQCVSLALNAEVTLTFVNVRQPAAVNIVKTAKNYSAGGTAPLAGATFTLYSDVAPIGVFEDGADTATAFGCTTGASGSCSIVDILPPGDYCAVETTTPQGYDGADPQCITVELSQIQTLIFSNDPLSALTITFESLAGDGVTVVTSVVCNGPDIEGELGPLNDGDSHTLTSLKEGTYSCTIVVDP